MTAQKGMPPTVLTGIGVGRGAAVAPLVLIADEPTIPVGERPPRDGTGAARIRAALADVAAALTAQATTTSDTTFAQVLDATSAMAADPALVAEAVRRLHEGAGPATAVHEAVESFAEKFLAAGGYLAERVTDLYSVRRRAVAHLLGLPVPSAVQLAGPAVIGARSLAPADTAGLDLEHVVAIVTEQGGPTAHTAIIARQLGLPCLVHAVGVMAVEAGTVVLVDAAAGTLTVAPTPEQCADVSQRAEAARVLAADTRPGATADGHGVALLANVGSVSDVCRLPTGAVEGVGLFRTEVLFLERPDAPGFDEQVATYSAAVAARPGSKIVLRTLDAGADKPLAFVSTGPEENPAMGVRGYRLVRPHPHLLGTQLAALGAVVAGLPPRKRDDVWVMAPMISTVGEARRFATSAHAQGISRVGVMIEVPAAALRVADLLSEVDFVSIGTNDLAQYTMAADRLRGELVDLLDPWQPAVLDLVRRTAAAGIEVGKPVGVCGESASDPLMALVLTGLGVTSLSMASAAIPAVRYALRRHTFEACQRLARHATAQRTPAAARQAALDLMDPEVRHTLRF